MSHNHDETIQKLLNDEITISEALESIIEYYGYGGAALGGLIGGYAGWKAKPADKSKLRRMMRMLKGTASGAGIGATVGSAAGGMLRGRRSPRGDFSKKAKERLLKAYGRRG